MLKACPHTTSFLHQLGIGLWLPLLLLSGLSNTALASVNTSAIEPLDEQLNLQRKQYQQAEHAFRQGHFSTYKRLSKQLKNYPLHSYLEYKSLTRNLSTLNSKKTQRFLNENTDTVIGDRFRLKLINHAAQTHKWQTVIDAYQPIFGVSTECKYLNALIHTQQSELAFPRVQALWLSPRSQPKSCNEVFSTWQAAGQKTPQIIWQRFKLAMSSSNRRLARFLIRSMPKDDAHVARLWLKIHKKPELVLSEQYLNLKHVDRSAILLHGLKRLAHRDIELAKSAYHTLNKQYLNPQQSAEATRHIGLYLSRKHMDEGYDWLARVPASHINKQVREWKIRSAIR